MSDINQKTPEDQLDELENNLSEKREKWNKRIINLSERINGDIKDCILVEAEALSFRQIINEDIHQYTYKLIKLNSKMKAFEKNKFEFYATKYKLKTNSGEKTKLISADLAWYSAKMDLIDSCVTFLQETRKTVDHVIWSIKNKIEIFNITGLD